MKNYVIIDKIKSLKGTISAPPDKSITHRSFIFASLANGTSKIKNYLDSEDCNSTLSCLSNLGAQINKTKDYVEIKGVNLTNFKQPETILYAGNSGTTIRLLSGILSATNFISIITGDDSLKKRPMKRIIEPLTKMGATIKSNNNFPPLEIHGNKLHPINYKMNIASAQVKSAILFAALVANVPVEIEEPAKSRDHTEIFLKYLNQNINIENNKILFSPKGSFQGFEMRVPGDFSSAAFFIALTLISKNSEIIIKNVNLNPTRAALIDILKEMNANIKILNQKINVGGEPVGDIKISSSELKSIEIGGEIIPKIIDEIPLLSIIMAFANGTSKIKDAKELRVKESDRIKSIVSNFKRLNIPIKEFEDGMEIKGRPNLIIEPTEVESFYDHRIAMSMAILAPRLKSNIKINNINCINISFPTFFEKFSELVNQKNFFSFF